MPKGMLTLNFIGAKPHSIVGSSSLLDRQCHVKDRAPMVRTKQFYFLNLLPLSFGSSGNRVDESNGKCA
jgi:hypothetical protein